MHILCFWGAEAIRYWRYPRTDCYGAVFRLPDWPFSSISVRWVSGQPNASLAETRSLFPKSFHSNDLGIWRDSFVQNRAGYRLRGPDSRNGFEWVHNEKLQALRQKSCSEAHWKYLLYNSVCRRLIFFSVPQSTHSTISPRITSMNSTICRVWDRNSEGVPRKKI